MNCKNIPNIPRREWNQTLVGIRSVYVVPTKRKHDSGWACMEFIADVPGGSQIKFGGCCDDISFEGKHFRMDCDFESKLIHIWNDCGFNISEDLSSISFEETSQL